jgi:hypothetical protein
MVRVPLARAEGDTRSGRWTVRLALVDGRHHTRAQGERATVSQGARPTDRVDCATLDRIIVKGMDRWPGSSQGETSTGCTACHEGERDGQREKERGHRAQGGGCVACLPRRAQERRREGVGQTGIIDGRAASPARHTGNGAAQSSSKGSSCCHLPERAGSGGARSQPAGW